MHFKCLQIILVSSILVQTYSLPSNSRYRRQTGAISTSGAEGGSAIASAGGSGSDEFGIGAAAGIGGMGRSVGIGNFHADTKSNPFLPWGSFAGINFGRGQRLGAGCSGLSCGVQLGNLVLATPQLLGTGTNFGRNRKPNSDLDQSEQRYYGNYPNNYDYDYDNNPSPSNGYNNNFPSSDYQPSFPNFLNNPNNLFNQIANFNQQNLNRMQQNVADFARFGNGNGGGGDFSGGAFTSTFGSSNGKPTFSSTSIHVGPDGKVTTVERGSDQPDKITTRIQDPENSGGSVFAASGTKVDADGNVSSFRKVGSL